jgi:hypothetical protein
VRLAEQLQHDPAPAVGVVRVRPDHLDGRARVLPLQLAPLRRGLGQLRRRHLVPGRAETSRRSLRDRIAPAASSSLTIAVILAAGSPVEAARSLRETGPSSRIVCSTPVISGTVGPPPEAKNRGSDRSLGR